jgi:hypothetical protein
VILYKVVTCNNTGGYTMFNKEDGRDWEKKKHELKK